MLKMLKYNFKVKTKNKVIVPNKVYVEDGVLYLLSDEETFKFEDEQWFIKTPLTQKRYIPIGLGALPSYRLDNVDPKLEEDEDFNLLFETVEGHDNI